MVERKTYWDSDRVFRHNVVYPYMKRCGYEVKLMKHEPPRINIGILKRKFKDISDSIRGPSRGSVDFDVLGYNINSLVVGEVKTRLIPRIYANSSKNLSIIRKFIGYHISSPKRAIAYWNELNRLRFLQKFLDNETSISELGKELLGVLARDDIRYIYDRSKYLYVGLFILDMLTDRYYKELFNDILDLINWYTSILNKKGDIHSKIIRPFITIFRPERYDEKCRPLLFTVKVIGEKFCLNNTVLLHVNWSDNGSKINGCIVCNYYKTCNALLRTSPCGK